tara:strand:- start:245 stop:721 length:477 start_codon:yes stop_codon:yes gene_type:complete
VEKLIAHFYESFANLHAEEMAKCYHNEVVFEDPAFGVLKGERARNMWRMLCESQQDKGMKITYSGIKANETQGEAQWTALYTFSKTGRFVKNKIHARFEFKDGLIIKHTDHFNLYSWSGQALGIPGYFIGWTDYFKKKLQAQTNNMLNKYEQKRLSEK